MLLVTSMGYEGVEERGGGGEEQGVGWKQKDGRGKAEEWEWKGRLERDGSGGRMCGQEAIAYI